MTTLETCLFQLLLKHDCVVVPNFGGFVAKHSSAKILANGTILPPSKHFTFNKLLKQNDGLLINSFAIQANISYDLAQAAVSNEIALWNLSLESGQRLLLDRIGYFVNDANNNLYFNADTTNFSLSSYGLPIISFERVRELLEPIVHAFEASLPEVHLADQNTPDIASPILAFDANIVAVAPEAKIVSLHSKPKKSGNRFVKYAAAAAIVLPIAFYTYWIPTHTNILQSGVFTLSDFNPFHVEKDKVKTTKAIESTENVVPTDRKEVEIDTAHTLEPQSPEIHEGLTTNESIDSPITTSEAGNFDLIAGSFNSKANAENLVLKLKALGYASPSISSVNSMFRVSAASTKNVTALQPVAEGLSQKGIETWILRK
jgi:hypothetical protein